MNYHLITYGHPPIIVYEKDCYEHYDALDKFDMSGDLKPLVSFLKIETVRTWNSTIERYEK